MHCIRWPLCYIVYRNIYVDKLCPSRKVRSGHIGEVICNRFFFFDLNKMNSVFLFAQGASKFAGSAFLVMQVTQVVSAAVFAGLDTNNYCKLNDQISSLQTQIASTKAAWQEVITEEQVLSQDLIKQQKQQTDDLIQLQRQFLQTQDEYTNNRRRFSVAVFILVLMTALNLFLNYFIKKQRAIANISKKR